MRYGEIDFIRQQKPNVQGKKNKTTETSMDFEGFELLKIRQTNRSERTETQILRYSLLCQQNRDASTRIATMLYVCLAMDASREWDRTLTKRVMVHFFRSAKNINEPFLVLDKQEIVLD